MQTLDPAFTYQWTKGKPVASGPKEGGAGRGNSDGLSGCALRAPRKCDEPQAPEVWVVVIIQLGGTPGTPVSFSTDEDVTHCLPSSQTF